MGFDHQPCDRGRPRLHVRRDEGDQDAPAPRGRRGSAARRGRGRAPAHVTEPGELVVQTATGLPIDLRLWRRRVWKPAAKSAGVTATPYDLRHTYCSLLAHEGRAAVYIAAMMGHSTTRMQDRYSHVIADAHMSPLLPMADAISQARSKLERGGLHSRCTQDAPAVLRRSL